jgi:hypothetical protein
MKSFIREELTAKLLNDNNMEVKLLMTLTESFSVLMEMIILKI